MRRPVAGRPVAALIGLFALLIQALLPAAALAAQPPGGDTLVICTAQGLKTVALGAGAEPEKGFAGLPCIDCLAVSIAAAPAPAVTVAPVAYVVVPIVHPTPAADLTVRAARAPPRPPGQGPPAPNA
jgi:hypothetical protein